MDFISPRMRWMMATTALVGVGIWLSFAGAGRSDTAVAAQSFYDTVTGELFEAPADQVAPIESPSGHEAVRAVFFVCDQSSERFLGYYQKYTPEAKAAMRASAKDESRTAQLNATSRGRLISRDAQTWLAADEPEAGRIQRAVHERCPDRLARLWRP